MNDVKSIFNLYNQLRTNPSAILSQFGIPADMMNNPQQIIQTMLNQGRISQAQLNQAMNMRNNPIFKQFFNN